MLCTNGFKGFLVLFMPNEVNGGLVALMTIIYLRQLNNLQIIF